MKTRIITGAALALAMLAVIVFSGTYVYPAAIFVLLTMGLLEMLGCVGLSKNKWIELPSSLAAVVGFAAVYATKSVYALLWVLVLYLFVLFAICVFKFEKIKLEDVCTAFAVTAYVTVCFVSLLALRYVELDGKNVGQYIFVLAFVSAWVTDTFAYFTGVFFGKHKLIPTVSPKKTIEGSVGGIVFCVAAFIIYGVILQRVTDYQPNFAGLVVVAVAISVFSQVGDLIASVVKRTYGVKDYGKLFPGHGGVLDRFDSIMAVSPLLLLVAQNPTLLGLLFK